MTKRKASARSFAKKKLIIYNDAFTIHLHHHFLRLYHPPLEFLLVLSTFPNLPRPETPGIPRGHYHQTWSPTGRYWRDDVEGSFCDRVTNPWPWFVHWSVPPVGPHSLDCGSPCTRTRGTALRYGPGCRVVSESYRKLSVRSRTGTLRGRDVDWYEPLPVRPWMWPHAAMWWSYYC